MTVHYISTLLSPLHEKIHQMTFGDAPLSEDKILELENIVNAAENSKVGYLAGLRGIGKILSHDVDEEFDKDAVFGIGCLLTEMSRTLTLLDTIESDARFALHENLDRSSKKRGGEHEHSSSKV